ncbi:hypothetical protein BCV69DRAFT_173169 [Microstroma glucosiphilum]|uniref:Ribonuclease H n=1 Tax=Pseudomicrostroma glucosiphilum TaxID=1684307 RepID=A0A316U8Q0_9BASI|nr:hypothetical protein BCV69DRAFT_173169 [Pseudomicrostroma glucosiphilum]PWN21542.1 hypothetical protein BCV69DRAFT_173169 [Pseudomicrostroma glucosiphilum]
MGKKGYYAVQSGRSVGVYDTWAECKQAVDGYSGASFKRFDSHDQASAFAGGSGSASGGSRYSAPTTSSRSGYGSSDYGSSDYSYRAPRAQAAPAPSRRDNIYIDGAAPGNGRDGSRAGYGIYHENQANQHLNRSERLNGDIQTNNRAELTAAIEALRGAPRDTTPVLHTDSRYTMGIKDWLPNWERNGFRNANGEPVANQDLVRQLDHEIKQRGGNVEFEHVRGHTGVPGNEMADRERTSLAGDDRSGSYRPN